MDSPLALLTLYNIQRRDIPIKHIPPVNLNKYIDFYFDKFTNEINFEFKDDYLTKPLKDLENLCNNTIPVKHQITILIRVMFIIQYIDIILWSKIPKRKQFSPQIQKYSYFWNKVVVDFQDEFSKNYSNDPKPNWCRIAISQYFSFPFYSRLYLTKEEFKELTKRDFSEIKKKFYALGKYPVISVNDSGFILDICNDPPQEIVRVRHDNDRRRAFRRRW